MVREGSPLVKLRNSAKIETEKRPGAGAPSGGSIMFDTLLAMGVGAGFFVLMYQWVTMIAEAMP